MFLNTPFSRPFFACSFGLLPSSQEFNLPTLTVCDISDWRTFGGQLPPRTKRRLLQIRSAGTRPAIRSRQAQRGRADFHARIIHHHSPDSILHCECDVNVSTPHEILTPTARNNFQSCGSYVQERGCSSLLALPSSAVANHDPRPHLRSHRYQIYRSNKCLKDVNLSAFLWP